MKSIKKTDLSTVVFRFLRNAGIGREDSLLTAFSGGPDSACLLHILGLLRERAGFRLAACYVDHGLRGPEEMEKERSAVTLFCSERDIPLTVKSLPGDSLRLDSARSGRSLEETARTARYRALYQAAGETGSSRILLAHTLDDHLETVIMRFFEGSGMNGLQGIRAVRGKILRPLLTVAKEDIMAFLDSQAVSYVEDSTNAEALFLRNRLRNSLLPVIREVFPGYGKALLSFSEKMGMVSRYIEEDIDPDLPLRKDGEGGYRITLDDFNRIPPLIRLQCLYRLMAPSGGIENRRIPYSALRFLLFRPLVDKNGLVFMKKGYYLQIKDHDLFCSRRIVYNDKNSYFIVLEGEGNFNLKQNLILSVRVEEKSGEKTWLPCPLVSLPLIVRSRLPGDSFETASGKKKLKSLFNSWKVPETLREVIPIVEDRRGIIFVLGSFFGFDDTLNPSRASSMKQVVNFGEKGYSFSLSHTGVV